MMILDRIRERSRLAIDKARYRSMIPQALHDAQVELASGVAVHLLDFVGSIPNWGLHEVQREMLEACRAHPLLDVYDGGLRTVDRKGACFTIDLGIPEYVQERRHYGPDGVEIEEKRTEHLFPAVKGDFSWLPQISFPLNLTLESEDGAELGFVFFPQRITSQADLDHIVNEPCATVNGDVITVKHKKLVDQLRYVGMCPAHGLEIHTYCLNPFRSYEE